MQISLNGEQKQLATGTTVAQLIHQLGYTGRRLAIEINGEIIPRSQHNGHALRCDDRIEVVAAIGGG